MITAARQDVDTTIEPLSLFLRRSTAEAHARLEGSLDMMRPPLQAARFVHLLERFYGFHCAWEAALGRYESFSDLLSGRSRVAYLRQDLLALGRSQSAVAALPWCLEAGRLADQEAQALGSAYVMEGSTLGGQLIRKALEGQPWRPAAGLGYFNPYGPHTGEMWRSFRAWLDAHPAATDRATVRRGAVQTFGAVQAWLTH